MTHLTMSERSYHGATSHSSKNRMKTKNIRELKIYFTQLTYQL